MDKYFVCLANSYKRGGRCVAGIEIAFDSNWNWTIVRNNDKTPHWIRPIDKNTVYGEIPNLIAFDIKHFSIVKLVDVAACPQDAHVENVYYSRIEACQYTLPSDHETLRWFVDPIHQSIFHNRGKAISTQMLVGLNYSLMLIHVENARAYIDEEREKSKSRMHFTYYSTEYDFPITDPVFLDELKKSPERFTIIPNVYLSLSLGLEFEGWHHKLVASVIIPKDSIQTNNTSNTLHEQTNWFNEYERELAQLLDQKEDIEKQINELRQKLLKQMESYGIDKVNSSLFSVNYTPAKTILQFDSRAFRKEYEELYSSFCKPKQREASIIVKRHKTS